MLLALAFAALVWLALAGASLLVSRSVGRLDPVPGLPASTRAVGIVIPARDEEAGIEAAVRSLLAQEGVRMDVVAVNDGSTDATRAILERLSARDPRLRLLHDPELPEGWLGKVNAMHRGAAIARGDWLLFTDADVLHHPRALASALALADREGLDMVALMPTFEWESVIEHGLMVALMIALVQMGSPRLNDPACPDQAAGSGSFTLVRRSSYERAGGHAPLRAAVLDDIALGRLLKRSGARVAFLMAPGLVRVRMFRGNRAAFWGLSKNILASFGGKPAAAIAGGAVVAALLLVPLAGIVAGLASVDSILTAAGAGAYLLQLATLAAMRGWHRFRWTRLPAFPVFALTAVACIGAAVWHAAHHQTVSWRGRRVRL
jgi:hypothetical protein